jgi:predicted anti-sigma-YlaC factor YlaD
MTDCGNSGIRELLPDVLHDSLSPVDRERVMAHVSTCADCRAELDLLSTVYAMGTRPALNVSAIAGSIAPYKRRPAWLRMPPVMRIAAGLALAALGGASYSIVNRSVGAAGTAYVDSTPAGLPTDSTLPAASSSGDPVAVTPDLSALDDQGMRDLIAELEKLDGAFPVEPRPLIRSPRVSGN